MRTHQVLARPAHVTKTRDFNKRDTRYDNKCGNKPDTNTEKRSPLHQNAVTAQILTPLQALRRTVLSTVQYSTVQHSTAQHSTAQYSTVQYSTAQHSTVQYSTVQYSTVQYSTVQYSTSTYLLKWLGASDHTWCGAPLS